MAMSSEDLAATSLPQETPQQGDQSQMMRQRRALAQAGSPQQGPQAPQGPQPQGPPQPVIPGAQAPPQQPASPAQPPPQQSTLTPQEVNQRVFSPPQRVPYSYQEGLDRMVSRAESQGLSVPYLRLLRSKARQGVGRVTQQPPG